MPYEFVQLAHHVSAVALVGFIALGIAAPLLVTVDATRANLYPVEGMGGFACILFQIVSGAVLSGRSEIPWNTPWIAIGLACLLIAVLFWVPSLARRAKGNTGDRRAPLLNAVSILALFISYGVMLAKPTVG